jgi:hypothetical protein
MQSFEVPFARLFNFLVPVTMGALVYFGLAKWMGLAGLDWVLRKRKKGPA